MPLRQLPGQGPNGETTITVPVPWTPGDILNLVKQFPNIREEPQKFKDELETVIHCYDPTWADLNQLMSSVLPSEVRNRLIAQATWPTQDPGIGDHLADA